MPLLAVGAASNIGAGLWRLFRIPLLVCLVLGGGYLHGKAAGVHQEREKHLQGQIDTTAAAVKVYLDQARADAAHDRRSQAESARLNAIARTVQEEITRYASSHAAVACLDDDGLRLWRAANAGSAAGLNVGAAAMPAAATAGERSLDHFAAQPRGDGGAVSPVQLAPVTPGGARGSD